MDTIHFLVRIGFLFVFNCAISLSSFAQTLCDGQLKVGEYCSIYAGTTIIEGNNNSPLMYMEYNESMHPQGLYDVKINGVNYEDEYFSATMIFVAILPFPLISVMTWNCQGHIHSPLNP